jgi:hypothetical protein
MEAPLEIRYAGVVIGRAQEVRGAEGDGQSFFIPMRDPMPVGAVLHLRAGDRETPVRVVRAVETTDAAQCGMQVRTIGETEEVARDFIPPPAVVGEKSKVAAPTPAVEVGVVKMQAESATPATAENPAAIVVASAPVSEFESSSADLTPKVIVRLDAIPEAQAVAAESERKAVEAVPVATAGDTSGEIAAIPEAVPVAVGSSMTDALKSATESISIGESESAGVAKARDRTARNTSPSPDSENAEISRANSGVVAEAAPEAESSLSAASGDSAATDLPPARPIAGPSGRRKTKRRK